MVNLWWCFPLLFSLPLLQHSSLTQLPLPLSFSRGSSQDQAIVADRRRVGSINRNWTNYKADVPQNDGGRTLFCVVLLWVCLWLSCFSDSVWLSPSLLHHGFSSNMFITIFFKHQAMLSHCYLCHNVIACAHVHTRSRVWLLARSQPTFLNKPRCVSLTDSLETDCGI